MKVLIVNLVVIYFIQFFVNGRTNDELIIRIKQGLLRGTFMETKSGRKFSAFLGIPFAKPPLNDLRFKAPIPIDPWESIKNATEVHAICPQRDIFRRSPIIEGDEDCLYLNVYTPQKSPKEKIDLPVMVFFHGGGWLCGGGNSQWYGPGILLDKDVVLVVTNFRLGALGFLSTGDHICPGNNGLKDQNLALKWIRDNIKKFGGNPEKITIFGESAGGVSVNLHMYSQLSRGLFHAGISQSGTAQCSWAVAPNDQAIRNGKKLAQSLNCPINSNKEMIACLQKIDPFKIVEQDKIFMEWDFDPMIPFKPVIEPELEGAFLTAHPTDLIKMGKISPVPWIVGLNTEDGSLRVAGIYGNPHLIDELNNDFERIAPISLLYDETTINKNLVTKKIKNFYFGENQIDNSTRENVVHMFTDAWFLEGIDESVRLHLRHTNQPVYYYLFGHRGSASFTEIFGHPGENYGVCHADELQYLFPIGDTLFAHIEPTEDDRRIAQIMTNLWVNFAQTGKPTPEINDIITEEWKPVKSENMEYYFIDADNSNVAMQEGLFLERSKFWRTLPTHPRKIPIKEEL